MTRVIVVLITYLNFRLFGINYSPTSHRLYSDLKLPTMILVFLHIPVCIPSDLKGIDGIENQDSHY